jgi:hypothetical protein
MVSCVGWGIQRIYSVVRERKKRGVGKRIGRTQGEGGEKKRRKKENTKANKSE